MWWPRRSGRSSPSATGLRRSFRKCLHTDDLPTGKQHPMQLKRIYWIATALLALMYLAGGAYYLSDMAGVQAIYPTLGYPPYLVPSLRTAEHTSELQSLIHTPYTDIGLKK